MRRRTRRPLPGDRPGSPSKALALCWDLLSSEDAHIRPAHLQPRRVRAQKRPFGDLTRTQNTLCPSRRSPDICPFLTKARGSLAQAILPPLRWAEMPVARLPPLPDGIKSRAPLPRKLPKSPNQSPNSRMCPLCHLLPETCPFVHLLTPAASREAHVSNPRGSQRLWLEGTVRARWRGQV